MTCCGNDNVTLVGTKQLLLGERRKISILVWLTDGTAFTPTAPGWELIMGAIEASGACDVAQDGGKWELTAEIEPKTRTTYRLVYTFGLGSEIVKREVKVVVK